MILYQFKCKGCQHVFEEVKAIKNRSSHPCPVCGGNANKTMGGSTVHATFKPKWYNNIAPVPVYIENPKQFSNVASMMGNYANKPFCRSDNGRIKQPKTPAEKKAVVAKLKRGEY